MREDFAHRRERIARIIAAAHFNRRPWYGACPKAERTEWLVNTYWPQWAEVAEQVMGE